MKQHKFNIYLTDYIQKNTTNTESMIREQIILNTKSRRYLRLSDLQSRKQTEKNSNFIRMIWFESCVLHITNIRTEISRTKKMIKTILIIVPLLEWAKPVMIFPEYVFGGSPFKTLNKLDTVSHPS